MPEVGVICQLQPSHTMDLYGRPAPRQTSKPAVAFLNERPKSLSFSSGFKPSFGRVEDPLFIIPGRPTSNQQQQHNTQQPPVLKHQPRPASSRSLNRPHSSSGIRRPEIAFTVSKDANQRPHTARDKVKTLPLSQTFVKRTSCFEEETKYTEIHGQNNWKELLDTSPSLDEKYLEQLKADILYLHVVYQQLERETNEEEKDEKRSRGASQAPNHVKNLLLHRDTKTFSGWSSQRNMNQFPEFIVSSTCTASIQVQLLRYNYSSDPAQLTTAKIGLEGLLSDMLTALIDLYLVHNNYETEDEELDPDVVNPRTDGVKMKLVRPPTRNLSSLPFANGCGTSPASIYTGGIVSILQQTERLKCSMLACTAEKNLLVKVIADKAIELNQLTEQIGVFKDVLARRRPRFTKYIRKNVFYDEKEQNNTPETEENRNSQYSDQSRAILAVEQLARIEVLEEDRVQSMLSIQILERQKEELELQLEKANLETQTALEQLQKAKELHEATMTASNNSFQEKIKAMEERASDLQSSLTSIVERYRSYEESTSKEKSQLRRDKQELERLNRLKDDEIRTWEAQASKAEAQIHSTSTQLNLIKQQFDQAQQALNELRVELTAAQVDKVQFQDTIRKLHHALNVHNEDVATLNSKLSVANIAAESKNMLLQQSEARIATNAKEIERQQALLDEQTVIIQALEAKLSRSVPVDDEEFLSRQQREDSAWHQRVSTLEHALVAERQNAALLRDQQSKEVVMEQEKAVHAVEKAQAVAVELATANLCLLERKRQREQEQNAFEEKLKEYADRVAEMSSDRDSLNSLRSQHEQLQQENELAVKTVKILQEDVAATKEELKSLTEIREKLDRALAHALATPKAKSARHQANLSELRAELQKAKQKIAVLDEQLSRSGSIRTSEIDGKLGQLSSRERRFAEEQKGLKKQRAEATAERRQLENERVELDQHRELQLAAEAKQQTDHALLQDIIVLLAERLQVLMELFDTTVLPDLTKTQSSFDSEDVENWREVQQKWEALHNQLKSVDWKLLVMRRQLQSLYHEYIGGSPQSLNGEQPSQHLKFHGPNPFSDAVAAGRDTVPVAEQLKENRLLRRLLSPGESLESRACRVKAEEHETFALALAREMTVMKNSYEKQLEKLRGELLKTQQLRRLTSQRLRTELATERSRSQRTVAQLSERIAELETALVEHEKAMAAAQNQQQAIVDRHAAATNNDERQRTLQELVELVGGEQRRRERERLAKLLAYCGASSVTVKHRDRAVEQEAVDEVLQRLEVEYHL